MNLVREFKVFKKPHFINSLRMCISWQCLMTSRVDWLLRVSLLCHHSSQTSSHTPSFAFRTEPRTIKLEWANKLSCIPGQAAFKVHLVKRPRILRRIRGLSCFFFLCSAFEKLDFNTSCFRLKSIHLCRLFMRLQWFYFYEGFKTTVAQSTTKELLSRGSYRAKY